MESDTERDAELTKDTKFGLIGTGKSGTDAKGRFDAVLCSFIENNFFSSSDCLSNSSCCRSVFFQDI
ncbi:MAG: hypothetical protein ACK472_01850 [Rhodoluna sp.]